MRLIFSLFLNDLVISKSALYPHTKWYHNLLILVIAISFFSQIGDLFVSFLKRKAKVKDTGKILPGHGGMLDRIDGILLGLPLGIVILNLLS